jgi:hypothetical protein
MLVRLAALASLVLTGAFGLASLLPPAAPAGTGEYVDSRLGFKMFVPKAWTQLPLSLDERWMVAKFLSDKTYFHTEKGGGWTSEHKPDLQVIAFVAEAMKEKLKVEKREAEGGVTEWRIFLENPYKSYEDFLKGRYAGGGWYVSDKKEGKVNDVLVTQYEIKVEKLSMDGPKRIFTWIYHVPDVDIAVQYEVLENSIDKLKTEIQRTQKSFKPIPRKGGPLYEVSTPEGASLWVDQEKMTKDERKAHRQGLEQKSHEKVAKTAPDGWKVQKMGRFLVMNHADEKFAKSVVDQCEAVWDWLDKTFPFVGEGEYVRSPVIRICATYEEYRGFFKGGSWFSLNDLEITTYQDFGGKTSYTMESVNRRVKDIWFKDRDVDLWTAMPGWLGIGLDDYVGRIHVAKNGGIEIGADLDNKDDVRERLREGKMTPLKQLLTAGDGEFREWGRFAESGYLFGYFANGSANKNKRTKDLLPFYVKNLREVALAIKKESAGKSGAVAAPKTEEEEDALFKNQQQGFKAAEKRLLEETFQRTFIGWTDEDWKKFQEAYEKSL